jgi:large subunit ribosomal protein L1
MRKRSKNYRNALKQADLSKAFDLKQAVDVLKKISYAKFNASVDLALRLGVDPRQANQMVRGVALLPHGTGKEVRVLVLTGAEKQAEARQAGAEFVGLEDYIAKIEQGWTDVDVIICSPDVMPKVGRLGKILGPRGLMPNPKSGTVTPDVAKAVKEVKAGKIDFKVDKTGILHCAIGKMSFTNEQIIENATELIQTVQKLKPAAAKDTFFLSIYMSSTMSPSIQIDKSSIAGIQ